MLVLGAQQALVVAMGILEQMAAFQHLAILFLLAALVLVITY